MVHNVSKRDWPRLTWQFPRIHNFNFGFGLSVEDQTKNSTIVPYFFQDNALVDYENIKTNPENADFSVVSYGNTCAGSYIPRIQVHWIMYIPPTDTTITMLKANSMVINSSMLNRLDAFDKKTGNDIETILELQHETTDEQCYPLWSGIKLFEGQGVYDYWTDLPGLTTDQQPESVAFDKEMFFDAMHYYTNRDMLKFVTQRMKTYTVTEPSVPRGRAIQRGGGNFRVAPLCKF